MKKIKFLVFLAIVLSTALYSCADNNPVNEQNEATKSWSLLATLSKIKKDNASKSSLKDGQSSCFDFVFPIKLGYNTGNQIIITSFDGLLTILNEENATFYIEGIVFPFQVSQNGALSTISNENEFQLLVEDCGFNTIDESFYLLDCYDIVYPFSVVLENNQIVVLENSEAFFELISNNNGSNNIIDFVFPISLTANGVIININTIYELISELTECDFDDCFCNFEYSPVCVLDANGTILSYGNPCFAECDGYTVTDFVNCDTVVSPANFGAQLGTCFNINYPVQVGHQNNIITVNNNGELLQYWFPASALYPAFVYPISATFVNPNLTTNIGNATQLGQLIGQNCN